MCADQSLAGCADGGSNGGAAATAVEGRKMLFTVLTLPVSALLTALQLEPELSNLKVKDTRNIYSKVTDRVGVARYMYSYTVS